MKKILSTSLILLSALLLTFGCSETMSLPGTGEPPTSGINSDPNKFARISPDWSFTQLGLTDPVDVFASKDGRLYIADSSEKRIRVIRPSGEVETGIYDTLSNLSVAPTSVCLDSRFNVYYTDDGGVVYFWPQFAAMIGIEGIITQRYYDVNGSPVLMDPLSG